MGRQCRFCEFDWAGLGTCLRRERPIRSPAFLTDPTTSAAKLLAAFKCHFWKYFCKQLSGILEQNRRRNHASSSAIISRPALAKIETRSGSLYYTPDFTVKECRQGEKWEKETESFTGNILVLWWCIIQEATTCSVPPRVCGFLWRSLGEIKEEKLREMTILLVKESVFRSYHTDSYDFCTIKWTIIVRRKRN